MKTNDKKASKPKWPWILALSCGLLVLVAILLPRPILEPSGLPGQINSLGTGKTGGGGSGSARRSPTGLAQTGETAEETVARKLKQYSKSQRELFRTLAKLRKINVPPEAEAFFDALEAGNWEAIDAAHKALLEPGSGLNQPNSAELHQIWRPLQEAWGIAREAHNWPAQQLLDYGEAVLGSLRPGMVYVGGTDPGCFIPTFLNATTEGEQHIVLTQNALADSTYLDYLSFLYGDRFKTLTSEDSQTGFKNYLEDAQRRFTHDQQFPDELKQLRPDEDVRMSEGRTQVSGQVAVMAVNEVLLKTLMDKNPDASFAIEQSFAFTSMYPDTTPLGPVMELRAHDDLNPFTPERATQSVDYWRTAAQQFGSDSSSALDSDPRKAYAKLAAEQASLLASRNYASEAEQVFQFSSGICPTMPEAVFGYVDLLKNQNRFGEAIQVAQNAALADPKNQKFATLLDSLRAAKR